ncbi:hypothetical protein Trydic_g9870 [Trypoxylus dichotomus]
MTLVDKVVILCFHAVIAKSLIGNRELGDKCGRNNEGECTLTVACPAFANGLKKPHELEICSIQEDLQFAICCEGTLVSENTTVRRSVQACENYTKTNIRGPESSVDIEAAITGKLPFFALVGFDGNEEGKIRWDCGGTLISETFVLTAGHCVVRIDSKIPKLVRLGTADFTTNKDKVTTQDIPVSEFTIHPEYHHIRRQNDIALLKLSKPAKFSENVNAVCLYDKNDSPEGLIAVGGGSSESVEIGKSLRKTDLQTYDLDKCNQTYTRRSSSVTILNTQLCALSTSDIPCKGDGGNPIYVENRKDVLHTPQILVGLSSFGRGCGGPTPDVYTRVSRYIDWIESIVWP